MRRTAALLIVATVLGGAPGVRAQASLIPPPPGHVRVTVEFRQASGAAQGGIAVQGTGPSGTVIQVDPGGVTGSARVQVQETQRTVRRTSGSFLIVQDGGEARLIVAEQIPEVVWFHQYALQRNSIAPAVVFRQVGTSLAVRPTILPNQRIRLKITPQISYRSDQDAGTIELVEATTEVVVQSGQPMSIGGTGASHEVWRQFLLGYERVNRTGQVSIVLTAETP
jgi:type II secretory pathway component GspD/PulD (secretin)